MGQLEPSTIAWGVLIAGVATYDAFCPKGQTLSEGVDRAIEKHPVVTIAAVGAVALHLVNAFDKYDLQRLDVIHQIASLKSENQTVHDGMGSC